MIDKAAESRDILKQALMATVEQNNRLIEAFKVTNHTLTIAAAAVGGMSVVSAKVAAEAGEAPAAPPPAAEPAKRGRGRPAAAAAAPEEPAATPKLDWAKDVKPTILKLFDGGKGRPACEAILKKFGLAKFDDAKPEQYAEVLAAANEALNGAKAPADDLGI